MKRLEDLEPDMREILKRIKRAKAADALRSLPHSLWFMDRLAGRPQKSYPPISDEEIERILGPVDR